MKKNSINLADNLDFLREVPNAAVDLIYIDPPFNTGTQQSITRLKTVRDEGGDRTGFGGNRYRTERQGSTSYLDAFEDYMAFLAPRIDEARRVLADNGSIFLHVDQHESHYCKVLLDRVFGRKSFINEIIWSYDYGGRSKKKWPTKHDTIFWYAIDPANYTFNANAIDRIPYMAPGLVGKEKAARGKVPTDVWWQTIVPTSGKERTGYPTQKPLAILERIVKVHSNPGDMVMDFFAGSGTTGVAAARNDRLFVLVDSNPEAVQVAV
ncbi:MAG TPA: site-specific DNA-methyltransferase [Dehalococcoidia bacterium]|nr:site-specific DNA-methyltransferase [Dehalococcoidia bacterium]